MTHIRMVALAGLLPMLGLAPVAGFAQITTPSGLQEAPAAPLYTVGQLDQMLAPIALYPDALLTQILMASTYPIQVVEAERWLQAPGNAGYQGDALVAVLQPLPWDPSVKSLVPFPQILKQLNDQLDWTQSLGAAFTNQQADVMAQVQVLRVQAENAGKLVTTPQIRVVHEGPAVVIEPFNPAVVYVPVYNPVEVYGPWAYAEYPPLYFPPPVGFFVGPVGVGIGFSVGFGVAAIGPLWGWGHPAWGGGTVVVNNEFYSRISYNHAGFVGGATWHHVGPVGFVGGFHPGAGFHGPGPGFHGAGPGFHGAAPGFHGPAAGPRGPAGGFHSAPAAHGPAPSHGFAPAHGASPAGHPGGAPAAHGGPSPAVHGGPSPGGAPHGLAPSRPVAPASHGPAAPSRAPAAASHAAPSHSAPSRGGKR
jgi:hypothetical protein